MYKQSKRRFWDQEQGHKVKEQVDQLPHGKLSEKATLTLEQFVAELKKRIQDKEKQKNNQSLPRKNQRLPKNTDEKQKIIPKQIQPKSTSSRPKTSSLKKTQKKNGTKISVKKNDLKTKQKTGIKNVQQISPKSAISSIPKTHKKPKFTLPKEGF